MIHLKIQSNSISLFPKTTLTFSPVLSPTTSPVFHEADPAPSALWAQPRQFHLPCTVSAPLLPRPWLPQGAAVLPGASSFPGLRQQKTQKSPKGRGEGVTCLGSHLHRSIPPSAVKSPTPLGPTCGGSLPRSWAPGGAQWSVFHVKSALNSNPEKKEYVSLFRPAW